MADERSGEKSGKKPNLIGSLLERLGRFCGFLLLVLVALQFAIVVARYVFSINYLWVQELTLYVHATIFMLAAPWALLKNRHVRIDVISSNLGRTSNSVIEIVGHCILLFPLMALIGSFSLPYILQSWSILEGSAEVSGLPGLFVLKSLIALFALLMIVAGAACLGFAIRPVRK
ncbi:MAG: TRAP transporter small permease subunit [Rhizobiaceae bacterium]